MHKLHTETADESSVPIKFLLCSCAPYRVTRIKFDVIMCCVYSRLTVGRGRRVYS